MINLLLSGYDKSTSLLLLK